MSELVLDLMDVLEDVQKAGKVFDSRDVLNKLQKLVDLVIEAARHLAKFYSKSKASKFFHNRLLQYVADTL